LTRNLGQRYKGSHRDLQPHCWAILRLLGRACEIYLEADRSPPPSPPRIWRHPVPPCTLGVGFVLRPRVPLRAASAPPPRSRRLGAPGGSPRTSARKVLGWPKDAGWSVHSCGGTARKGCSWPNLWADLASFSLSWISSPPPRMPLRTANGQMSTTTDVTLTAKQQTKDAG
jgi:hypothetical protein